MFLPRFDVLGPIFFRIHLYIFSGHGLEIRFFGQQLGVFQSEKGLERQNS
jgi:hypothetical protein